MSRKQTLLIFVLASACFLFAINSNAQISQPNTKTLNENTFQWTIPILPIPLSNNIINPFPKYRTCDGTANNIGKKEWGAAGNALYREMPAEYGMANRNSAMSGENRPSARAISNLLSDEPKEALNTFGWNALMYTWGQFIDHDMTLTPTGTTESVPILMPIDEKVFTLPISFKRSEVQANTGATNARQQINLSTSWIDGSQVYGSDAARAKWLRSFVDGKLKMSQGRLLPYNTTNLEATGTLDPTAPSMKGDNNRTTKTFVAGDVRAAENPGLASVQIIFAREHNRICDRLKAQGITNDEEMYQKARKEV